MLLLTITIVFVVDTSGFTDTWKGWLSRWLGCKVGRVRPFDCALCASFWGNIIYLLCNHSLTIPYLAFSAVLAAFTSQIGQFINLIRYAVETAINGIYKLLDRLWKRN